MALLWKMTCNLRHPMGLRHPVAVLVHGHTTMTHLYIYKIRRGESPPVESVCHYHVYVLGLGVSGLSVCRCKVSVIIIMYMFWGREYRV